ncbi:MAG: hypothetical protein MJ078_05080 [Clostridia bacterium]|nr:hypothetical protein [Clostridia bacterium]
MKKKIVCLLLCFVLLATAVPAVGIAAGAANLVTVDYKDETGADATMQVSW